MSVSARRRNRDDGGRARVDFGLDDESARAAALDASGNLVLAGVTRDSNTGQGDFALTRLNAAGSRDPELEVELRLIGPSSAVAASRRVSVSPGRSRARSRAKKMISP